MFLFSRFFTRNCLPVISCHILHFNATHTHSHQLAIMANLNFYHVYKQTIRASSSQPVKETGKRERAGGNEERKSKLQVSPSERRNLALRTTFAYRFHMRHVESFSQPHPPPPFPMTSPPPLECKYNPF